LCVPLCYGSLIDMPAYGTAPANVVVVVFFAQRSYFLHPSRGNRTRAARVWPASVGMILSFKSLAFSGVRAMAALALMIEAASERLAYLFPGNLSVWQRARSVFNRHT
jgi:hypothetical protein